MQKQRVYFDCNATTPLLAEAAEAASRTLTYHFANPSSTHWDGCLAQKIREDARSLAGKIIGVPKDDLLFTSGATESIHTAVFSALYHWAEKLRRGHKTNKKLVLYGATEHKAAPEAIAHWIENLALPFRSCAIPVDAQGNYDRHFLRAEINNCVLICTIAVNNETGVIQDLSQIKELLHPTHRDITKNPSGPSAPLWLVDGVQALGKLPLNLNDLGANYAAFSGHKIHAPKGIGLLYVRPGSPFRPLFVGGGQESGRRSGTEALPAVAGLGAVFRKLIDSPQTFRNRAELSAMRSRILKTLKSAFGNVQVNAPLEHSLPTTLNFSVPELDSAELLVLFEAHGISVSAGSACQASRAQPSHVLKAMNIPHDQLISAVRLSMSPATSEDEVSRGLLQIQQAGISLKNSFRNGGDFVRFARNSHACVVLSDPAKKEACIIGDQVWLGKRTAAYLQAKGLKARVLIPSIREQGHRTNLFKSSDSGVISGTPLQETIRIGPWSVCLENQQRVRIERDGLPFAALYADLFPHQAQWTEPHSQSPLKILCRWNPERPEFRFPQPDVPQLDSELTLNDLTIPMTLEVIQTSSTETQVIDLRETFELTPDSPYQPAYEMFRQEIRTVPVSEFAPFLHEQMTQDPGRSRNFAFVCRTGVRSGLAARTMRAFGWRGAHSLAGGLSCLSLRWLDQVSQKQAH